MAIKMRELLAMTPDGILEKIGQDVCVDRANQKLTGSIMYKVMLYTLAKTTRISLRMMESIYASPMFQKMIGVSEEKSRHSSFADRLKKINPDYFAQIFEYLVDTYNKQFAKKEARVVHRFDSTIIGLSTRLFSKGMNYSGLQNKLHVKVTIGQRGAIPSTVRFYTNQAEASEDVALRRTIREANIDQGDFVLFDRGLTSGKAFIELCEKNVTFITRIKISRVFNVIETMEESNEELARKTATLAILSDQKVQLMNTKEQKFFTIPFRLIKAKSLEKKEDIWFLTNDFTCCTEDVTELYKRRWDVEVFFRFIKQELNFKHFLARNMNGLTSYLYMVLILAILFLIYKTSNDKTGYKIAKMEFIQEMENEVIADLIYFSGGDPDIFRRKYCPQSMFT